MRLINFLANEILSAIWPKCGITYLPSYGEMWYIFAIIGLKVALYICDHMAKNILNYSSNEEML